MRNAMVSLVFFILACAVCCGGSRYQPLPVVDGGQCLPHSSCNPSALYRTYDGSCSNLHHTAWARKGYPFIRIMAATYQDGKSSVRLAEDKGPLPYVRRMSDHLFKDHFVPDQFHTVNVLSWGQLIAHDVTHKQPKTASNSCCTTDFQLLDKGEPEECLQIEVPEDDPFYSPFKVRCLNFFRAKTVEDENCQGFPFEQINNLSHVIDGSPLYGSDETTAYTMRSFVGGKLKVEKSKHGGDFLFNASKPNIPCFNPPSEHKCYFGGDDRVNQNTGITVLTIALLRLHNHLCDQLVRINPYWQDEKLYQETRKIIGAFMQHVTYKHYLPIILGVDFMKKKGLLENEFPEHCRNYHNPEINPSTFNEFAGAAYRSFHSLVPREVVFVNEHYKADDDFILIDNFFFRPSYIEYRNVFDKILRGLATQPQQAMDQHITTGLTGHFLKTNKTFGSDLESTDIMSGRDMGLPPYNKVRVLCGLKKAKDFDDFGDVMSKESIWKLQSFYSSVDDVDLFIGGMLEKLISGSLVGPTFRCIIGEQFYHYMYGDRFYYENCGFPWSFTIDQINAIYETSVSWLFCVGSNIEYIQQDTFHKPSSYNPILPCKRIPRLDVNPWKESSRKWDY